MTLPLAPSNEDGLENIDQKGTPPKRRIRDAEQARSLFLKLHEADNEGSRNRAAIESMFDGHPPYNDAQLRTLGQAFRCNLNFGEAAAIYEKSMSGYLDLTNAVEYLAVIKVAYGDPSKRLEYGQIISQEFDRMLKNWTEFEFNFQRLCGLFVRQGVSFAYFDNPNDWRWNVGSLNDFKLPRLSKPIEDANEVCFIERGYPVHVLYRFIRNEAIARQAGWNVGETRDAILRATTEDMGQRSNWEKFAEQMKNNDLSAGYGAQREVRVVHALVKEFDGTVTHSIFSRDGGSDSFLFEKCNAYPSMSRAYVVFPYGTGNGSIHSIRGLGFKLFPHIQVSNRLRCQIVDGAMFSSSLALQPLDAESADNIGLTYHGPLSVLPPNFKVVEKGIPNFAANVMPILREMSMTMVNNVGSYNVQEFSPDGAERTKFEVQAQLSQQAVLSVSAMNLFYIPWGRLLKEMVRRACDPSYRQDDPGGKEVFEFRKRVLKRGVPLEALDNIESVRPMRAVGYGSEGMRLMAYDEFLNMSGMFDESGRRNLVRDRIAARVGYDQADRYAPPPVERPTDDQKIAELENASLQAGIPQSVTGTELHKDHLLIHMQMMGQLQAMLESGIINLAQIVAAGEASIAHCSAHLQIMSSDAYRKEEVEFFSQELAAAQRVFDQHMAALQGQMEEERNNMQAQMDEQGQNGGIDPKLQMELHRHELKMQMMQEQAAMKNNIKEMDAEQKMRIRDLQAAQKIRQKAAQREEDVAAKQQAAMRPKGAS
jgi:hypothetical protein